MVGRTLHRARTAAREEEAEEFVLERCLSRSAAQPPTGFRIAEKSKISRSSQFSESLKPRFSRKRFVGTSVIQRRQYRAVEVEFVGHISDNRFLIKSRPFHLHLQQILLEEFPPNYVIDYECRASGERL